jgi:hypothetical protein
VTAEVKHKVVPRKERGTKRNNNNNNNNNNNKHLERQPSICGRHELNMACRCELVCGRSDQVTVDCSGERGD